MIEINDKFSKRIDFSSKPKGNKTFKYKIDCNFIIYFSKTQI